MFGGLRTAVILIGSFIAAAFGDEVSDELCLLPDGNFPNPDDCGSFIRCNSGVAEVETCPNGLLFNPFLITCDHGQTGNCSTEEDFEKGTPPVETEDIGCPDDGPNIFPIPSSCPEYYLCINENAYRAQCPEDLLFNIDKMTCDFEDDTSCDITSTNDIIPRHTRMIATIETSSLEPDSQKILGTSDTPTETATDAILLSSSKTQSTENEVSIQDATTSETESLGHISTSEAPKDVFPNVSNSDPSDSTSEPVINEETTKEENVKSSTSVSVTEFTTNKSPTVISVSTEQTEEGTKDASETTNDLSSTKLIETSVKEITTEYSKTVNDLATSTEITNTDPDSTSSDYFTTESLSRTSPTVYQSDSTDIYEDIILTTESNPETTVDNVKTSQETESVTESEKTITASDEMQSSVEYITSSPTDNSRTGASSQTTESSYTELTSGTTASNSEVTFTESTLELDSKTTSAESTGNRSVTELSSSISEEYLANSTIDSSTLESSSSLQYTSTINEPSENTSISNLESSTYSKSGEFTTKSATSDSENTSVLYTIESETTEDEISPDSTRTSATLRSSVPPTSSAKDSLQTTPIYTTLETASTKQETNTTGTYVEDTSVFSSEKTYSTESEVSSVSEISNISMRTKSTESDEYQTEQTDATTAEFSLSEDHSTAITEEVTPQSISTISSTDSPSLDVTSKNAEVSSKSTRSSIETSVFTETDRASTVSIEMGSSIDSSTVSDSYASERTTNSKILSEVISEIFTDTENVTDYFHTELTYSSSDDTVLTESTSDMKSTRERKTTAQILVPTETVRMSTDISMQTITGITDVTLQPSPKVTSVETEFTDTSSSEYNSSPYSSFETGSESVSTKIASTTENFPAETSTYSSTEIEITDEITNGIENVTKFLTSEASKSVEMLTDPPTTAEEITRKVFENITETDSTFSETSEIDQSSTNPSFMTSGTSDKLISTVTDATGEVIDLNKTSTIVETSTDRSRTPELLTKITKEYTLTETLPITDESKQMWTSPKIKQTSTPELPPETITEVNRKVTSETLPVTDTSELEVQSTDISVSEILTEITSDNYEITDTNLNFSETSTSAVPSSTDASSPLATTETSSEIYEYISTKTSDNSAISQHTELLSTDSPSVTSEISPEITRTQETRDITNETPFHTETSGTVTHESTDPSSTYEIADVTLTSTSLPETSAPAETSVGSILTTEMTSEIPKVFETTTEAVVPATSTPEQSSTDFSTSRQNYTLETPKTIGPMSTETTNTPDLSTKSSSDSETSITESPISEKVTSEPSAFTDTLRTSEISSTSEFTSQTTNAYGITTDGTSIISETTIRKEKTTDISVTSNSYDITESSTITKESSTDSSSTYESSPDNIATKTSRDSGTPITESFSTISTNVASETSAPTDISRIDELSSTQLASTTKLSSEITDVRETSTGKMSTISVTAEQLTYPSLTSNSYDIADETSTFAEKSSTDTSVSYGSTKVNNDVTTKMSSVSETFETEPHSTISEKVTSWTLAFNETSNTEELSSTQFSSTTELSSEETVVTVDKISTISETEEQSTESPIAPSSYITFETTTEVKSFTDSSTTYESSSKVNDILTTKTTNNSETTSTESTSFSEKLTYETSAVTDSSRSDLSSTPLSSTELSPEITDVYETTDNKFSTMSETTRTEKPTDFPTSNSYITETSTTAETSSIDGSISYTSTKLTTKVPDDATTNTSPISGTVTEIQITTEETIVTTEKPTDFSTSNSYDIGVETSTTIEKSSTDDSISYGSSTILTSKVPDDVTNASPISETSGTATEGKITTEEMIEISVTTEYEELTSTESPTSSKEIISTTISSNSTRDPRFHLTSLPTDSTTTDIICISPSGFYPNPDDCNTFYQCSKGIPKLSFCTENFHFSPVQKVCDEPCKAKCDENLDCPTSATEDNLISSTTAQVPESTQTVTQTLPSSTSALVTTDNGRDVYNISTPEATDNTNVYTDASDTPSRTTMNDISTTGTESITKSSDITGVTTSENTQTPPDITEEYTTDELNITTEDMKTVSTSGGTSESSMSDSIVSELTTISTIPTNADIKTVSESTSTDFESSSDVSDDMPSSEIPSTTETSTLENISSLSTSSGTGTEDKNPTESYTSTTVSTLISDVPLYTLGTKRPDCEDPADCQSTDDPEISTLIPYGTCHRNDFLPHRKCDRFINCTGTIPKMRKCAKGLHFNPTSRVCDWPYKAGCGNISEPLYEPDDSFTCPCRSCLIPSNENCQKYILCLGFTAYPMKCSNNLLFDSSSNTCTYAYDVDCPIITTSTQSTEFTSTEKIKTSTTESTTVTSTTKGPATPSSKATSAPTSKPFVCPRSNGLFKHPDNCQKFIQCSNWRPYRMSCPASLHFNVEKLVCDYPCNAKCDLTLRCGTSTETPNDPRCPCRNCKLASESTCTKYIECTNGIPRAVNCPWGQTFDTKRSTCDWAHKVDCQHSAICPRPNGLFSHEDCHKFVHCSNGIPYIKKCPYILEFDAAKQRCEWPNGRCKTTISVKEADIFKTEEHREGWKCPKSFGYFIEEQHCNKFYYCSLGTPSLKECSDGLLYNPKIQNCDWKKNVRCDSHRNGPKKCRMYNGHVTCPRSRAPLPHTHCNMYYDCSSGAACARRCPVGLYFNKTSGLCDKPVNVQCFHPATEEQYSLKDFSLSCMAGDRRKMMDPTDNACFYHCRHGHVLSGCCSKGHIYNEQRDRCDRIPRTLKIRDVSESVDSSSDSSDSSESL